MAREEKNNPSGQRGRQGPYLEYIVRGTKAALDDLLGGRGSEASEGVAKGNAAAAINCCWAGP